MALAARQTGNSIGYVDYACAVQMGLSYALLRNPAGNFATPGTESFQAAAASAAWDTKSDFYLLLTDAPGENAYPIVATVFVLMPKEPASRQRARAALSFFQWVLENGTQEAARLGYVPLPPELISQVKTYWASTFGSES